MRTFHVAIVGAGQRGVAVLERIGALFREAPFAAKFVVHLIDPADSGQGVHRTEQPRHLITNTPAHVTTAFTDESVLASGPATIGPSYSDWLTAAGRHAEIAASLGDQNDADLFTPRALLGEYLKDAFLFVLARLPRAVSVIEHRSAAVGVIRQGADAYQIQLASGSALTVSYLFLCTGHGIGSVEQVKYCSRRSSRSAPSDRIASDAVAATRHFDAVDRTARVLIVGAGLTAIDVVSTLTLGRGGRFKRVSDRRSVYVASGDEPSITLCSRQGLPPLCRSRSHAAPRDKYKPEFFTDALVRSLRSRKPKLDWEADLWPALKRDIIGCFQFAMDGTPSSSSPEAEVDAWLYPWKGRRVPDREAHRVFVESYVADDLDDALVGAAHSPRKAATEMLRDLNDVVRAAVDYGGLTPESHESFLRNWVSINNRVAAGPPKERSVQLLALLRAGIVRFFEPAPEISIDAASERVVARSSRLGYDVEEFFDAMIEARVRPIDLAATADPLLRSGRDAGLWGAFRNGRFAPGGLAINEDLNVLGRSGRPSETIWALGHCVEGAHYYTYVLPAPGANSRNLRDCAKAALSMLVHARRAIMTEKDSSQIEIA